MVNVKSDIFDRQVAVGSQLGKRGLYGAVGGRSPADRQYAMLWVLNQSDGAASLLDVARRSGVAFDGIRRAAEELAGAGLVRAIEPVARARTTRARKPARKKGASKRAASKKARRRGDR